MSIAVLQPPISLALGESSFPTPSNQEPAFFSPPAWFAPADRDVMNSTDSLLSTLKGHSGHSLQDIRSDWREKSLEEFKSGSSLQEVPGQKTSFLSYSSSSSSTPSPSGELNNNSTVWSRAFSDSEGRLPLPFSPLLAPVHLSLLLTGKLYIVITH